MNYQVSKPSDFLSRYIKQYWAIENCVPTGKQHIQRIVPNGLMELMFYLGDRPKSVNNSKNINENTILSGQQKEFYDIIVSGKLSLFSIQFQPHGATMFFDIPLNEFYNQNVPLKYIIKDKVIELESLLYETATFSEKVGIVEYFLTEQLRKCCTKYEMNRISKSVESINRSGGIINIEFLSSEACLSRKQYERTFSEYIGTSPKQFLKIVRFQNTLYAKQKNSSLNITELAYDCGYYDQSHMINEYKKLSGLTPKQYFSECEPVSDYF
jgi:AraC-like DNA-binding protein